MKKLILAAATVLFVLPMSQVTAQDSSGDQPDEIMGFVGYSDEAKNARSDVVDGRRPVMALDDFCRDDFGTEARMCTTREFFMSAGKRAPSKPAWIRPGLVMEGESADYRLYCDEAGSTGLVVLPEGKIQEGYCNVARPVTCCRPAP